MKYGGFFGHLEVGVIEKEKPAQIVKMLQLGSEWDLTQVRT